MHDIRLRKTQMNEVYEQIRAVGLSPVEFEWTEADQEEYSHEQTVRFKVSVLTHRPTSNACIFGGFSMIFSPGHETREEMLEHDTSWQKKKDIARYWLNELEEEVRAPDLWATIAQEKAMTTAASSTDFDNGPFTADEQNLISAKLDEIKGYLLASQQFVADQAENIERNFDYLRASSQRLGRKDWLNTLVGALVGQAINLALSPELAKGLLVLAASSFQTLWKSVQGNLQ